jgi:hypothetical protein
MKFRIYKKLSNVGLWTISTRWWQNLTVGEAIVLMHKAFDVEQYISHPSDWFRGPGQT